MRRWAWLVPVFLCAVGCSKEAQQPFRITAEPPSSGPEMWSALYQTTGALRTEGNVVQPVDNGAVFDAIEQSVAEAQRSINVVLFIWRPGDPSDRMVRAVTERARAGVACRVLVDPIGSVDFEERVKPELEASGCQTFRFRPLPADENLARNHRKIVIVDGQTAITGGFGIYESWLGDGRSEPSWRDSNVLVRGPVVAQLQQAFAENWQEASGEVLPLSDFPQLDPAAGATPRTNGVPAAFVASTASPEVTRAERLTQLAVQMAHRRLWIAQAYFTPNEALAEQLKAKARAGVDVRVLAPGDHNDQPEIKALQREGYDELLEAGVRIWEYQPSMMHSKTMLVDDALVVVGSINYDPLSFNLLEEGSLVVQDVALGATLAKTFEQDLEFSKEIVRE